VVVRGGRGGSGGKRGRGRGRGTGGRQVEPEQTGNRGSRKRVASKPGGSTQKKARTDVGEAMTTTATGLDPAAADATMADQAKERTKLKVPVGYLDLETMKGFLAEQELPADREPEPISVGVVVWNINHLKAEEDDDATDDDTEGAPERETTAVTYDIEAIRAAMDALKMVLKGIAGPLNAAVGQVIDGLDKSAESEQATGTGPASAKYRKVLSAVRTEVSQLKRDIEQLLERDLDEVLTPGITAMIDQAKERGKSPVEIRADQLERIRSLNRVWRRLVRLRAVLFTGRARLGPKIDARTVIRGAQGGDKGAPLKAAIDELLKFLSVRELNTAIGELKSSTVVDLITSTFFQHPAVSLVLINEMNLGIDKLATAAERSEGRLGLSKGPIMLAKGEALGQGESSKGKAAITIGSGQNKQQVLGKQYEYYPAMHRAGSLSSAGTFYVSTGGNFAVQHESGENSAIPWNKADKEFRGIVVHRYHDIRTGQEFWAGVLHTTPAGKDLERKNIWPQIKTPLDHLNKLACAFKIPLIIGGDFYIPAEGIVTAPDAEQKREILDAHPDLLNTAKLWHLARNVFLAAAAEEDTAGPLEAFVQGVGAVPFVKTPRKRRATKEQPRTDTAMQVEGETPAAATTAGRKPGRGRRKVTTGPGSRPLMGISKPEHLRLWNPYREAVKKKVLLQIVRGKQFKAAEATYLLAQERNYKDVFWSDTLGAGSIGEADIYRNYERPSASELPGEEPRMTMQRALGPLGYRIVAAGSPTNPKASGRGENKMQLADLFLVNAYWKTTRSGILTPNDAKLRPMDDGGLSATRIYWKISDHSPVLMLGSTEDDAAAMFRQFDVGSAAERKSVDANQHAWDIIGGKLAEMAADAQKATVADQIEAIKRQLNRPFAGPDKMVNTAVRAQAQALKTSIEEAASGTLTPEQQAVLRQLEQWDHPYYTIDFSEEMSETGSGPEPGVLSTLTLSATAVTGATSGTVTAPSVAFPTGEIAHTDNSCYLAAIIHVLASDQAFSDLLSSVTHPLLVPQMQAFQRDSGLRALVTTLRSPDGKIGTAQMAALMRYLDSLPGMLVSDEDERPETTGMAYGVQQDAAEILLKVLNLLGPSVQLTGTIESTVTRATGPSITLEDHQVIPLPLGTPGHWVTSIEDALRRYCAVEPVDDGTKHMRFAILPQVLTFSLNRFRSTGYATTEKITRLVAATSPLTIPDECLSGTLKHSLAEQPAIYRLVHVVHHQGWSLRRGHYRSYGRLTGSDQWYVHDDRGYPERREALSDIEALPGLATGYIYIYVRVS
jgi:hypothetical protein